MVKVVEQDQGVWIKKPGTQTTKESLEKIRKERIEILLNSV